MSPAAASPAGSGDAEPRLTVAALARRLGVAPATLRTWDRRYGLGPSGHAAGAHRRYSPADVGRLEVMRHYMLEGVPPAEAARLALASGAPTVGGPFSAPPTAGGPLSGPPTAAAGRAAPAGATGEGRSAGPQRGTATGHPPCSTPPADEAVAQALAAMRATPGGPGGRVLPLPGGSPELRGLARAVMSLDAMPATMIIRRCLDRDGVVPTWNGLIRPALIAAGQRWAVTGEGVDVEHLLSECVIGALRPVTATLREPRNLRPVLLASAEDENHCLPLHAVAAALAERGIGSRFLGAAVPADALLSAVRRTGPAALFVWSQLPATGSPDALESVPLTRPPTSIVAGGPGWPVARLPARVRYVEDLDAAVEVLRTAAGG